LTRFTRCITQCAENHGSVYQKDQSQAQPPLVRKEDLERKLFALTGDETILEGSTYDYKKDLFLGHCSEDGNAGYHMIAGKDETFKRVGELYD
jgi:hypothetical protein